MNDFFSKLENFLFDILGLILPGAIFLLILLSPILFLNMNNVPDRVVDTSMILSALRTISNILKDYWTLYPKSVLTIAAIMAYLIGHTVKVLSRIKYEFLTAIFDQGLNRLAILLYDKIKYRVFRLKQTPSKTDGQLAAILRPVRSLIAGIFIFKPPFYHEEVTALRQNCQDRLNTRIHIKYPEDDYWIVKISSVITNQENLRSLGTFFLAKYNLYRSLALIFLFTTFYYWWFFKTTASYISATSHEISGIILAGPAILWFTFHLKYKRYWTLYGDERLMTLFYFLNKKVINER